MTLTQQITHIETMTAHNAPAAHRLISSFLRSAPTDGSYKRRVALVIGNHGINKFLQRNPFHINS